MRDDAVRQQVLAEVTAGQVDDVASPFDAVAQLAAWICGTPMAAVNLVGGGEQHVVGSAGVPRDRVAAGASLCAVAMLTPDVPLVIPDTWADSRAAADVLLAGGVPVRSYAGVPVLSVEGVPLGTLCVLGDRPGGVTAEQLDALQALGAITGELLQARRTSAGLRAARDAERSTREQFRQIFDSASTGMTVVTREGTYARVNDAFAGMLGYAPGDLVGRSYRGVVQPGAGADEGIIRDLAAGVRRTATWETSYRHRDGTPVPALVTTSLIPGRDSEPPSFLCYVESLVERRAAEAALMELHSAVDGIIGVDGTGVVIAWNYGAERLLGYRASQMLGRNLDRIIPAGLRDAHNAGVARVSGGGTPRLVGGTVEVPAVHADGHEVPTELSLTAWTQDGSPRYTAILRDITERRQAELHTALVRHATSTANGADSFLVAADAVLGEVCGRLGWIAGHSWTNDRTQVWHVAEHPHADGVACRLTGYTHDAPVPDLGDGTVVTADLHRAGYLGAALDGCGAGPGVVVPVLDGGEVVGMLGFLLPEGAAVPDARLVETLEEIGLALGRVVERERAAAVLVHQATHDPVTDLANRRRLLDQIGAVQQDLAAGRAPAHLSAVLLINLDRFRLINDSLGYAVGDQVLRQVAERIRAAVHPGDLVARLGADEFVVLTHRPADDDGTAPDEVLTARARDLLHRIGGTVDVVGHRLPLRASVGVCAVTAAASHYPAGVLRDADAALRQAKRRGKDQVQVYDAALRSTAAERIDEETALAAAIGADQLLLHYQPIIDLQTGSPTAVEALVRWERPGHGMVPPDRFIPLAEESGLIVDLGRWVLRRACRDAAAWAGSIPVLATVSVNVSTRQLIHPRFLADVREAMTDHGLPPERLVLEITESALIEEPDAVMATLRSVRALGVRLALDDFGTGYSSLSYVQNLPVTILKIDKSFVDPIAGPGEGTILSEVVLKLAEATGMRTVAEGVETRAQAEALRQLGCHRGQGYTWSRPVPAERLPAALDAISAAARQPGATPAPARR